MVHIEISRKQEKFFVSYDFIGTISTFDYDFSISFDDFWDYIKQNDYNVIPETEITHKKVIPDIYSYLDCQSIDAVKYYVAMYLTDRKKIHLPELMPVVEQALARFKNGGDINAAVLTSLRNKELSNYNYFYQLGVQQATKLSSELMNRVVVEMLKMTHTIREANEVASLETKKNSELKAG